MGLAELNCSVTHLALAWVVKQNPYTSTVILGASKPEQVVENLKALDVLPKLTGDVLKKVEDILGNAPAPIVRSLFFFFALGGSIDPDAFVPGRYRSGSGRELNVSGKIREKGLLMMKQ